MSKPAAHPISGCKNRSPTSSPKRPPHVAPVVAPAPPPPATGGLLVRNGTVDRLALAIDGAPVPPCLDPWPGYAPGSTTRVGEVTSAAWSPDFDTNVAIGMVQLSHWTGGTQVEVETPDGGRMATVRSAAFI